MTIDEIVTAAGIAKGSFYRYFDDKSQLADHLFSPMALGVRAALQGLNDHLLHIGDPKDLSRAYGRLAAEIAALVADKLDLLRLYLQENRGPDRGARASIIELRKDIESAAFKLTRVAQEHALLRDDYDHRLGTLATIGAVERLLFAFLSGETVGADTAAQLIGVLLDGVRATTHNGDATL